VAICARTWKLLDEVAGAIQAKGGQAMAEVVDVTNQQQVEHFVNAVAGRHRIELLRDALTAKDLKWISGYISVKNACSPALWWHQDCGVGNIR
jgi:hypothetical protein